VGTASVWATSGKLLPKKLTEALKARYNVRDWKLTIAFDDATENYGDLDGNCTYKEAHIRVHPAQSRDQLEATLHHEMGELVMEENMFLVPIEVQETDWFKKYRDSHADAIGKIGRQQGDLL
jgi:hypothetical protein